MLKYRLISAFILIPIVVGGLFFLNSMWFAIFTLIICMIAAWEWGQLSGFTSYTERTWIVILCGLLLSIVTLLILLKDQNLYQLITVRLTWIVLFWWMVALFLVLFYPKFSEVWRYSKILRLIFGLLTIVPFFCAMLFLRCWNNDEDYDHGSLWILYIMILVWGVDSGSYFFGKIFGKHKLMPKVSPGKTWQGFVGGLLTAVIISISCSIFINLNIAPCALLLCSVITALVSVLGDLTQSMLKRESGIKDSGCLIPGHGGLLDRIDSLTAAVPVFLCLLSVVLKRI